MHMTIVVDTDASASSRHDKIRFCVEFSTKNKPKAKTLAKKDAPTVKKKEKKKTINVPSSIA